MFNCTFVSYVLGCSIPFAFCLPSPIVSAIHKYNHLTIQSDLHDDLTPPFSDRDLFAYTAPSQKPADVGFLDRLFLTAVAVLLSSLEANSIHHLGLTFRG